MATETPASRPRGWRRLTIILALLSCLLAGGAWWVTTATFWERLGWRLVAAVQDRLLAELTVAQVSGNLVSGMVFRDVVVRRGEEPILTVHELEVSVSLWSFLKLQPVIRTLIFRQPNLFLRQSPQGEWNVANLLKKRPPPPFTQLHFQHLAVQDGQIQVKSLRRWVQLQELQVQLAVTIQHPGRPQIQIMVPDGQIAATVPPYPAWRSHFTLTASAAALQVQKLALFFSDLPAILLQGEATDLTTGPQVDFTLTVPTLTGKQVRQFWEAWPAEVPLQGEVTITGPLAAGEARAVAHLASSRVQAQANWRQPDQGEPEFQLSLNFLDFQPAWFAAGRPVNALLQDISPLSGELSLRGRGQPWQPQTLTGQGDLQPFTFRQLRSTAARVNWNANTVGQTLSLQLRGNFGQVEATAKGQLWPGRGAAPPLTGELHLTAADLNPAPLAEAWGRQAPAGALNGTFMAKVHLPSWSGWREARLTGALRAGGRLGPQTLQEVLVQGSWAAGEGRVEAARLHLGNLMATAQGRLSATEIDAKWALQLSPPGPWPLLPPTLTGQGQAAGTLKGSWQEVAYQLQFQGQALTWRNYAVQALQGQASGSASRQSWRVAGFDLQARGVTTPLGRFGQISGQGRSQEGNLIFDLKAKEAPGHGGEVAGVASWSQGSAQIRVNKLQWGPPGWQVAAAEPTTLTFGPGLLQLTPFRLRYQQTLLVAAAKITPEDLSGQIRLENLQLADLAKLYTPLSLFKGAIQGNVELQGSGRSPLLRGQVQVNGGSIGTFRYDTFVTTLNYQGNLLSINGQLLEKPEKGRLAWQGSSPLTLSLLPWSWRLPEEGLQVRVWTENLTLGLFQQLIPQVAAAEGPLDLQTQITGSLRQPHFTGGLRYGPGSLTIQESGAPFALEPGEIRLEGDRLVIRRLHFQSGDGRGEIAGGARLPGFRLQDVQLTLTAHNLLAIRRVGSWAVANGQVKLSGSWPDFQMSGRLTVSPGQFRLGFFRAERNPDIVILPRLCRVPDPKSAATGAAAVVRNFTMDLTVDIPGQVWLRDKDANVEMAGQIFVRRRPPGPKFLGGYVRAKEGVFAINNKTFTIDKAMLLFPDAPFKPIRVEARASRQVEDYTLSVFAVGPMDSLRTGLESNPPLPPRDQLSLLLFDHLADKMTREEYITATQRAMGLLGGLTAQQLKAFFGDTLPLLGEVSPTTSQAAVGVGKKLGRGLTVSYERRLNPLEGEDVNQIRLNYKIHKYLSAESQLGRKNPGGDIFFNIDF